MTTAVVGTAIAASDEYGELLVRGANVRQGALVVGALGTAWALTGGIFHASGAPWGAPIALAAAGVAIGGFGTAAATYGLDTIREGQDRTHDLFEGGLSPKPFGATR